MPSSMSLALSALLYGYLLLLYLYCNGQLKKGHEPKSGVLCFIWWNFLVLSIYNKAFSTQTTSQATLRNCAKEAVGRSQVI